MPYKDAEKRKEVARVSMEKKREGLTSGVNKLGVNMEGLTEYPANMKPLLTSLGNPKQRGKLRAIYDSLNRRDLTPEVRYGINGPTFNVVGELLEAF